MLDRHQVTVTLLTQLEKNIFLRRAWQPYHFSCCCGIKLKTTLLEPSLESGDGKKVTLGKESKQCNIGQKTRKTPKKNIRLKKSGWESSNQIHLMLYVE